MDREELERRVCEAARAAWRQYNACDGEPESGEGMRRAVRPLVERIVELEHQVSASDSAKGVAEMRAILGALPDEWTTQAARRVMARVKELEGGAPFILDVRKILNAHVTETLEDAARRVVCEVAHLKTLAEDGDKANAELIAIRTSLGALPGESAAEALDRAREEVGEAKCELMNEVEEAERERDALRAQLTARDAQLARREDALSRLEEERDQLKETIVWLAREAAGRGPE